MEWESQDDGFVAKILLPEGSSSVEVGTPVIVIADSADAVPAFAGFTAADAGGAGGAPPSAAAVPAAPPPQAQAAAPAAAPAAPKPAAPAAAPRAAAPTPGGRVVASPYAKKLAAEAGISLAGAAGSGPGGRLVAADVQQLVSSGGAAPAGAAYAGGAPAGMGAHTDVPNSQVCGTLQRCGRDLLPWKGRVQACAASVYTWPSDCRCGGVWGPVSVRHAVCCIEHEHAAPRLQIRKVTARRLVESKQTVPHYYLTVSARVDALQRFRWGCSHPVVSRSADEKINYHVHGEPGGWHGSSGADALLLSLLCRRQQLNETLAAGGGGKLSLNDFVIKVGAALWLWLWHVQ